MSYFDPISLPNAEVAYQARELCDGQAKPLGALGRLEDLACWVASCQGVCPPKQIVNARAVVLAGDHGVANAGVSAYPAAVTPAMLRGIAAGKAGVSALAQLNHVTVSCYDISVADDFPDLDPEISRFKLSHGTNSIDIDDACSLDLIFPALKIGDQIAAEQVDSGADLLIVGDLGIGNTTIAAALIAATYGWHAADVVGRGTGVDDDGLARKTALIDAALLRMGDKFANPVKRLGAVGSPDMAVAVGLMLGAARRGVPILLDGVIAVAEAAVAASIVPEVAYWMQAGHRSTEPGQSKALAKLGLTPILDLGMRLGEGSGAVAAVAILRCAIAALNDIAQLSALM
ncbi:MAG: nicotinate-nucleotide--dimethylbenzimidazole phosphoribosyltransferase [Propionibacteriaceae bacterium]|jgi:nicotinate-nucleotide--dimethylbenzimidazole phosphoribosyltransferase|nr:nicotinate-nucleotide--dimethylbenzimidazole phosphoribosyltransferase [Propionibacteriaceae bacterium]